MATVSVTGNQVSMDFYEQVFGTGHLLVVLAGHTHVHTLDIKNGIPQIVSQHNATGYYLGVRIEPLSAP